MLTSKSAPQALKIVAWLFLIGGLISLTDVIEEALAGKFSINLNVLSIFIGIGLLRFNPKARFWALVFAVFWAVIAGLVAVLCLGALMGVNVRLNVIGVPKQLVFGLVLGVAVSALACWICSFLNRRDIRQMFGK